MYPPRTTFAFQHPTCANPLINYHRKIEEENAAGQVVTEQSWINFVNELRSDPSRVERLRATPTSDLNPALVRLWHILDWASARTHYGIANVAVIDKIAGPAVAKAAQQGLIAL